MSKAVSPVEYSVAPFGYDPTFLQTSALYRATNVGKESTMYWYYNASGELISEEVDVDPPACRSASSSTRARIRTASTVRRSRDRSTMLAVSLAEPPLLSFPWSCSALSRVTRRRRVCADFPAFSFAS